jgi:cyclin H
MQTGLGLKDTELLKETYDKANNTVIAKILLTDLSLIYQPTQLALAAFMIAGEKSGFDAQVETYIKDRFGENDAKSLLSIIKGIITSYKTEMPITQDEAKAIDRKLKMCKNPAMNPKSAL